MNINSIKALLLPDISLTNIADLTSQLFSNLFVNEVMFGIPFSIQYPIIKNSYILKHKILQQYKRILLLLIMRKLLQ
ncbi:hypothetical protein [Candidatus Kinetoplastidibacterium desouzai]|uniref:hypothetical protein n=1 Tax=Candidatus Kinetoplastidibacterium desouzai TaxID=994692 RepID=UPI001F175F11|nr:hypothetical protein [Candidatus Kinetoplastibacterium desouzaii]